MYNVVVIAYYLTVMWILNEEMKDPYIMNVSMVYIAMWMTRLFRIN